MNSRALLGFISASPGRTPTRMLCLRQQDADGQDAYYVLAERENSALRWRSAIRDNAVRRLRDEFVANITSEEEVDDLDVEIIGDGIHVYGPLLRMIHKIKGADHIALVSDTCSPECPPRATTPLAAYATAGR